MKEILNIFLKDFFRLKKYIYNNKFHIPGLLYTQYRSILLVTN